MYGLPQSTLSSFLLLLIALSDVAISSSEPTNHLSRGSHFSVERAAQDHLTSPDNTFTFGFYGGDNVSSNAYWLAVWFTASTSPKGVVWIANRDNPVNGHGSRLTLKSDGALVLSDIDGSVTWQSNTTSAAVDKLELLNTGNLVIRSPAGTIIWQSFDLPTDTLLPGQLLTRSTELLSGLGPGEFGSGYFSLFFDNDNVLRLIYNGPQITSIYWPYPLTYSTFQLGRTTYNSSRIVVFDDQGLLTSSDQFQIRPSDMGIPGTKRMLKMDYDGNLRIYSLNVSSRSWAVTYAAVGAQCLIHGLCGVNAICVYRPQHGCSCPPGYEQTNSTDWTQGCKPKFKKSCSDSFFVEMQNTDYYGFDLNYSTQINLEECKKLCTGDCRCWAFGYRDSQCFTKSTLFNGYSSPDVPGTIYIRLPVNSSYGSLSQPAVLNLTNDNCSVQTVLMLKSASFGTPSQHTRWVYLYSFASTLGVIEVLILAFGWLLLFGKHGIPASLEDGYRAISSQFRSFNYGELKKATNQFKVELGRGGFGTVYKGCLEDGRFVAVKRLGNVLGEDEFWAEVSTIGKINHMNLVRMWGFCSEKKHRLLVYEFIENGSLDKLLFSPECNLGWKERFKVATGAAKGLAYLHHECLEWIIHCDVKPENILLDTDFDPKIADFGLAKLSQRGGPAGSQVTKIRGTKGYMAPEWALNLPITAKVDVYGYGVVILELVKGIRLSWFVEDQEESELVRLERMVKSRMQEDCQDFSWIEGIVDPRLEGKFSRKQAVAMIKIGLSCLEEDRNKRPTMESVAQLLHECEDSEFGSTTEALAKSS
ncbi:hypothetical protein V2J09_009424 [Rumex salicifolius]